jgi:hypothetical protein
LNPADQKIIVSIPDQSLSKFLDAVTVIYNKYMKNIAKQSRETFSIYERAYGYTETNRMGSRAFNQAFGSLIEYIYDLSPNFCRSNNFSCDGHAEDILYESKSRYNTMKGSVAVAEITPKLKSAIGNSKKFYLLVLTDKNNDSRNIPLHEGQSLSSIRQVNGYNQDHHRWVSGNEIFKHLFGELYAPILQEHILGLLRKDPSNQRAADSLS